MAVDPTRTIRSRQTRPGVSPTPSSDPRVVDNLRDTGRQIQEEELVPEMATEADVTVAVAAGGGGIAAGAAIAKTANYTIVAADDGKTFSNVGATAAVTFTLDAGLAEGFEVRVVQIEGFDLTVLPPAGEAVTFGGPSRGLLEQGAVFSSTDDVAITLKKVGAVWMRVAGDEETSGSFAVLQLKIANLDGANGIDFDTSGSSTVHVCRIVQEAAPNSVLGSEDQTNTYTDGVDLGSNQGVYIEVQETSGAGPVNFTGFSGEGLTLRVASAPDWNQTNTALLDTAAPLVGGGATSGGDTPASTTNSYWMDTNGRVYVREVNGGGVTSFAAAVLVGSL